MSSPARTSDIDGSNGYGNSGTSPRTPSSAKSPGSTSSNDERSNNRYQRDEKFHANLKKAASFRRRLEREKETTTSTAKKVPEDAVARALNAAAMEFRNSAQGDDSFFDAAIDLAAAGSRHHLKKTTMHEGDSHLEVSDDWTLPEIIGVLVSRSRSTIRQQQQEILCLRLIVRELMHELLKSGSGTQQPTVVDGIDATANEADTGVYSSPSNHRDSEGLSKDYRSISTPPTASTTPASSESEGGTPRSSDSSGLPYSSHASNRHLLAKGARINRSFSGDGQDISPKLKEVQRSLDPKMRDAEQMSPGVPTVSPTDPTSATLSELQERKKRNDHQSSSKSLSEAVEGAPPMTQLPNPSQISISSSNEHSRAAGNQPQQRETRDFVEIGIENGVNMPSSPQREGRIEKTHVGHIVESILDAIIDHSVGKTGEESTMSSNLMFPGLQPKGDDIDQNSVLNIGGDATRNEIQPSRTQPDHLIQTIAKNEADTLQASSRNISDSMVAKGTTVCHPDPPAHHMRIESKTTEEVGSTSVPPGKESDQQRYQGSIPGSVSETHLYHGDIPTKIIEDYERHDDDDDEDDDDDDQGKRRMVALISGIPLDRAQQANQERAIIILHSNGIEADFVDGAEPGMQEIRDSLFAVSGVAGHYPQFFLVDDDGMTEFFGDFQDIEELNDAGELKLTFSRLSTTTTYAAHEELLEASHQEEKKDEHAAHAMADRSGAPKGRISPAKETLNNLEVLTPIMYIREEDYLMPSSLHSVGNSTGRLPMIREDHSAAGTQYSNPSTPILEGDAPDVNSSYDLSTELYGDGSRDLRWI